jgi:hypothetical protein
MTRVVRAGVLTAVTVALLAVTPTRAPALGRPCAQGELRVAVVVDFGDSASVSVSCVPAGLRDNGAQLLGARASLLGTPAPRFNASGLLCAIDNVPATGCGERTSDRYAYWSYWHGSDGAWAYSNFGPAAWRVQADVVEGWRFQPSGSGLPSDPPPRASASIPSSCLPAPPPTAPATVAPAAPPPASPTGGAPASPTTTTPQPAPGSRSATPTTRTPAARAPNDTRPTTGSAGATRSSTTTAGDALLDDAAAASARAQAREQDDGDGSGTPVGLIVGAVLVAALGAGGAVTARRRRASAP